MAQPAHGKELSCESSVGGPLLLEQGPFLEMETGGGSRREPEEGTSGGRPRGGGSGVVPESGGMEAGGGIPESEASTSGGGPRTRSGSGREEAEDGAHSDQLVKEG